MQMGSKTERRSKYRQQERGQEEVKRPANQRGTLKGELSWLEDRFAFVESWRALNDGYDDDALDLVQQLISDMTAALERFGAILDETITQVDPNRYSGYLKMWLEVHDKAEAFQQELAEQQDDSRHKEYRALCEHREKISWRLWQLRVRSGEAIGEREFYHWLHSHRKTRQVV